MGGDYMNKNVGRADRVVRIILAVVLGALVLVKAVTGTLAIVLGVAAVVLLGTGLIGWCGLYSLLGINTGKGCCSSAESGDKKCCCGDNEKK
jgi:hypothetical protein